MSVYTRPTRRPLCYDELSAAYRSTVGGILCIVNRLFCWNILKCQPSPPLNPQGTQKNSIYRLCKYGDRANTSDNCRSISCPRVDRDVGRVSAKMSADSVGRYSTEISAECRPRCRPIVSVECRSSIGRHINRHTPPTYSTDIFHRHSQPTSWPTLGREIDRHLVEHRSTCSSSW